MKLWKMAQEIYQKKKKMSLINTQTIQSQVDFHDLKEMIKNEVQEKECKKTKIKCDLAENIKKALQHRQFKYKVILCIFLKERKIIH